MTAEPLAREWVEQALSVSTAQARALGIRGYDIKAIDPRDYEAVLETGLMPRRHPRTKVIYLEGLVEAPRLFGEEEARDPRLPSSTGGTITWEPLSEVEMRSIVFRDRPLLQADAFHLLCGRKGQGKGTVIADVAARVTRGELGQKRNVVWIGSEDSAALDIKPRIVAAEGDPARVVVVKSGWVQIPRDIAEISRKLVEFGDVGMVIIDPLGSHISGKNSNSETDIRDAIAPLNGLADEHKTMVFGVRHLSEKECSQGVLAAILGSSAWVQVPRAVLAIVKDDDGISHIQCVAGNRLPAGSAGRMFEIKGVLLPELTEEVTRAVWLGESLKDVETMLAASTEPRSRTGAARELILDILEGEEQESDTLDARVAKETGLAAGTVRNARNKLKDEGLVRIFPDKDEFGEIIRWRVGRTGAPRT